MLVGTCELQDADLNTFRYKYKDERIYIENNDEAKNKHGKLVFYSGKKWTCSNSSRKNGANGGCGRCVHSLQSKAVVAQQALS